MLCLHPFFCLPTLIQACCSHKSLEEARKEGAEPSGQCDGQINSIESLAWLSNGLKYSHDFNEKPFQEVPSDDGPLDLMDSCLDRLADKEALGF